jgi:hypothetical protein
MRPRGAALPFLLAALTLLLAAQTATGTRFLVRPGGGGDFPTIQQAVAASSDGDSVILGMGTFRGEGNRDIDFLGKAITIASEGGDPRLCVIDCEGSVDAPRRGFVFQTHEGSGSLLQAIKIVNGYAARGGGVLCKGASPTLRELVLSANSAQEGGGIACDRASPVIENCAFVRNLVINNGGGILCGVEFGDNSSAIIRNCTFETNDAFAGGGIHCGYSYPKIVDCTFRENTAVSGGALSCHFAAHDVSTCLFQANRATVGGAIWCEESSSPTITSCTIAMNEASYRAGGLYSKASVPILRNTIIAWSLSGEAVYSREGPLLPELSCCDLYRNRGGDWVGAIEAQRDLNGNLGADPLFCNRWLSSFTIGFDSPCAAAQSGDCGPIGAFGVGCTEVPTARTTWGSIKAGFR